MNLEGGGQGPDSTPVLCEIIKPRKGWKVTREQPFSAWTFHFCSETPLDYYGILLSLKAPLGERL